MQNDNLEGRGVGEYGGMHYAIMGVVESFVRGFNGGRGINKITILS